MPGRAGSSRRSCRRGRRWRSRGWGPPAQSPEVRSIVGDRARFRGNALVRWRRWAGLVRGATHRGHGHRQDPDLHRRVAKLASWVRHDCSRLRVHLLDGAGAIGLWHWQQ